MEGAGQKSLLANAFAAECMENQAKRFGDHMDIGAILMRAAMFYSRSGKPADATDAANRAVKAAEARKDYPSEKLAALKRDAAVYTATESRK